jgi:glutamyl-Q tRNA(Asp) synthetase
MAQAQSGRFLLRIDDLDQSRARPHWEQQIYDDLTWLGVTWEGEVRRQSDHFSDYSDALNTLRARDLTFECRCSRRDIDAAANAPQEGVPEFGPDGRIYPGTCRNLALPPADATCTRLNMQTAAQNAKASFTETGPSHSGTHTIDPKDMASTIGDVVLSRRNMAAAYHLAVVLDDVATNVTHVIRGEDLFDATRIHVVLQSLLGLPTPSYHHHGLIRDDAGKRLAKRVDARAIAKYRADGASPQDIRAMVGL